MNSTRKTEKWSLYRNGQLVLDHEGKKISWKSSALALAEAARFGATHAHVQLTTKHVENVAYAIVRDGSHSSLARKQVALFADVETTPAPELVKAS